MGLPCCHILRVTHELNVAMCNIRWSENYLAYFERNPETSEVLHRMQSMNSPGVYYKSCAPGRLDVTYPIFTDDLSESEFFVMQFIHNSTAPCVRGIPLIDTPIPAPNRVDSSYTSGGVLSYASESDQHHEFTSEMEHNDSHTYTNVKREFDMVYNLCAPNVESVDLLRKALRDTMETVLHKYDHLNPRNENSSFVSPFPQIDTKKRSRRLGY